MTRKNEIPTGKLARSKIIGITAAKVGLQHLKLRRTANLSPEEKEKKQEKMAKMVFQAIGQLRGVAMKAAQLLSLELEFLPKAYRKELAKACYKAPPINRALIRKIITSQLGNRPEKLFKSFQSTPFAAASIGQVHEATLADGTLVAVKAQYPGITDTIQNDFFILRNLCSRLPYAHMVIPLLEEIKERLEEEVQYKIEAERTQWFFEHLNVEDVIIPEVMEKYSSDKVLTTRKLSGVHLDAWLETNPSQEQRNHFAELLLEVLFTSFFKLHSIHADPNPGNFLFDGETGKLGLIDFGCVKTLGEDVVKSTGEVIRGFVNGDEETVINHYYHWGIIGKDDRDPQGDVYQKSIKPFGEWLSKPFQEEFFDFNEHEGYTAKAIEVFKSTAKYYQGINKDFVFFDRSIYGLYRIFETMKAKVRFKRALEKYVD